MESGPRGGVSSGEFATIRSLSNDALRNLFRPVKELELSVRAHNCLHNAGVRFVGDLVRLTPATLLRVQNLGSKTLRELEGVLANLGLQLSVTVPNWPPRGLGKLDYQRISELAPSRLRAFLHLPAGYDERLIADLTRDAEDREKAEHSEAIPDYVKVQLARRIAGLDLSFRSGHVLALENVVYVGDLVQRTEAQLLGLRNFGRKSLNEIKEVLAHMQLHLGMEIPGWSQELVAEWERRFSATLQRLNILDPGQAFPAQETPPCTLEEELYSLALVGNGERNAQLTVKLFGWDGKGRRTLEAVGREYGLTRERVRQITDLFARKLQGKAVLMPILDRGLQFVTQHCPARADIVERELVASGLARSPFRIDGLRSAAELTGRSVDFEIQRVGGVRFIVGHGIGTEILRILSHARRSVEHWGCTTIADLTEHALAETGVGVAPNLVKEVVMTRRDFRWLDEASGWFWFNANPRNRMVNYIHKVLAVAPRVHVSELRSALSRHHRMAGFSPPRRVLLELCQQLSNCNVEGTVVIGNAPPTPENVFSDTELLFWRALRQRGPVMAREDLENLCVGAGMNRSTFYVYLDYSPIIAKFGRGVYGLVGSTVPPGLVESLAPARKRGKSLLDHGWTGDGKIWLAYELSRSRLTSGVFHVPSSMKDFAQGAHELSTRDGARFGTITVKDTALWGLSKLFQRRGGEPGDIFVLTFDPSTRQAWAEMGGTELLEKHASGEAALTAEVAVADVE